MLVDFDGRVLAAADPGPGEKIVVGPIDVEALRAARSERKMHHMLAHRRPEAYPAQRRPMFRGPENPKDAAIARLEDMIERAKREGETS
jgi:hypothetical protein